MMHYNQTSPWVTVPEMIQVNQTQAEYRRGEDPYNRLVRSPEERQMLTARLFRGDPMHDPEAFAEALDRAAAFQAMQETSELGGENFGLTAGTQ